MKFCSGNLCRKKSENGDGLLLSTSQFSINRSKPDGLQTQCRECRNEVAKKRRLKKKMSIVGMVEVTAESVGVDPEKITKKCIDCRCVSLGTDFRIDPTTEDKLSDRCRACERILAMN